jgi:hypothetical protein
MKRDDNRLVPQAQKANNFIALLCFKTFFVPTGFRLFHLGA